MSRTSDTHFILSDDINNQFSAIEHGLAHLENITEEISLEKLKETELRRFLAFESQKKRELDFLSGIKCYFSDNIVRTIIIVPITCELICDTLLGSPPFITDDLIVKNEDIRAPLVS